ncbi:hypothetical protein [Oceanobacillus jordanicus]|uniref:DUF4099 domain-containing protein n=1 Tax=Oceanobacillus jordanicus TaxID=2867266 RepID=A0AAW5B1M8_9BACI|nr:hypothetical protein [Oceanobacillus jordanicus]MCG3418366.1 hypothetical protein [Oceanobacillus jordanicus]
MSNNKKESFKEINVERLNIVDPAGKVKMSLFNQDNIPPVLMDGEDILPGHRQKDPISGIMFYNQNEDECGGLIYGNGKDENDNETVSASLTFDQFKQDQVVQMRYVEENEERHYGFSIFDRSSTPLPELIKEYENIQTGDNNTDDQQEKLAELFKGNAERAFMGKNKNGDVTVHLNDKSGKQRIRMVIDEHDVPKLEFLDAQGEVTYKLPPE